MINILKQSKRLNLVIVLVLFSFFCFALSIVRVIYTHTNEYLFLNWNLFLAVIPFVITSVLIVKQVKNKYTLIVAGLVWLLVFPNAPYMITDLYHLGFSDLATLWFDLVLIFSFAWVGLLFGIVSLFDIEKILKNYVNSKINNVVIILIIFLSSFGIYLGRYLRWNSWDIITNPIGLIVDILDRFIHPFSHPRTWIFTLLFGVFFTLIYWSIKIIRKQYSNLNKINHLYE
ncbi:DUF1361 domain-containing protein [Candidatus Falkowbacteria bacterium]|jgi:uncharacterized membrane protein|nr:DUF1361 domain-containing protein [Candidatus Falkowbacteria bacterium]